MADVEPIVGEALVRLSLEPHQIHFEFENHLLQIGSLFTLSREGRLIGNFHPGERSGAIEELWQLLEDRVESVHWRDSIEISFASGYRLEIAPGYQRGTISSIRHLNRVEDF